MSDRKIIVWLAIATCLLAAGCKSGLPATEFTNPKFDFSFVEKVAVLPFENLAADRQAGQRVTRIMTTELLASGAVDVVEPGEVEAAVSKLPGAGSRRSRIPNTEEIVALGAQLGVQAFFIGTVNQSENQRSGSVRIPVVSLDVHMVEAETGVAVWAATHTEKGGGFAARILGSGGEPISETSRRCVKRLLESLFE